MNRDDLEGRVLAHRRILQLMVSALADTPAGERLRALLAARSTLQDGQEDPGAVETDGMALELAVADEFRLVAEGIAGDAAGFEPDFER
ncbi:MAG TPA: hypothetical protein VFN28_07915 [Amaricoccus sp.]|jgi:hypothetical protein|nr:hypothetical protein [Amaricoccus sp.]